MGGRGHGIKAFARERDGQTKWNKYIALIEGLLCIWVLDTSVMETII